MTNGDLNVGSVWTWTSLSESEEDNMRKKNKYLGFGLCAILFGFGVLCWRANEQWKRDCEEAERYRNLMHDLADPIICAYNRNQIIYI